MLKSPTLTYLWATQYSGIFHGHSYLSLSPCCHFPLSLSPSVSLWALPYPLATQAPDSSFLAVARAINTVCLVSFLAGSIKHYRPVADYSRTPTPLHLLTRRNPSQSRRRGRRRLLPHSLDPGHRPARISVNLQDAAGPLLGLPKHQSPVLAATDVAMNSTSAISSRVLCPHNTQTLSHSLKVFILAWGEKKREAQASICFIGWRCNNLGLMAAFIATEIEWNEKRATVLQR